MFHHSNLSALLCDRNKVEWSLEESVTDTYAMISVPEIIISRTLTECSKDVKVYFQ